MMNYDPSKSHNNIDQLPLDRVDLPNISTPNNNKSKTEMNITWENQYLKLLAENKITYCDNDLETIEILMSLNEVPSSYYKEIWWIGSGAKRQLDNNPSYYHNILVNYPSFIPSPYIDQIKKDIPRSFPDSPYFLLNENITKLENVLVAYSRRNIIVGYCQGFNFIVGRLLMIYDSEEIVFWIFAQLIEEYFPPDYFTQIGGALLDADLITDILSLKLGDLKDNEIYIRNIVLIWQMSLFTQVTNDFTFDLIFTGLILNGMVSLFHSTIFFIETFTSSINLKESMGPLARNMETLLMEYNNLDLLRDILFSSQLNFTDDSIKSWREDARKSFYSKHMNVSDHKGIFVKNSLMNNLNDDCDCDWPLCLCDRKYRFEMPQVMVLKTMNKVNMIEDFYFDYCGMDTGKENKYKSIREELVHPVIEQIDIYKGLLMERRVHHCDSTKHFTEDLSVMMESYKDKEIIDNEIEDNIRKSVNATEYFNLVNENDLQNVYEICESQILSVRLSQSLKMCEYQMPSVKIDQSLKKSDILNSCYSSTSIYI